MLLIHRDAHLDVDIGGGCTPTLGVGDGDDRVTLLLKADDAAAALHNGHVRIAGGVLAAGPVEELILPAGSVVGGGADIVAVGAQPDLVHTLAYRDAFQLGYYHPLGCLHFTQGRQGPPLQNNCLLYTSFSGGITFAIGEIHVTLTNLAIAAIAGIALNAILPGKDYEFGSDVTEGRSGDFGRY